MSRSRPTLCSLPLLALATFCATAADPPSVSGHLQGDGEPVQIVDGLAYRDSMFLRLVFSDQPYDRADFAQDGTIDTMDFMRHPGSTLELQLAPEDGGLWAFALRTAAGAASGMMVDRADALELEHFDEARVAGRYDDGVHQVRFDLAIESETVARSGVELAADGGEPGAALRRMIQAVHSGDIDALIASKPSDQADEIRLAIAEGEGEQLLAMTRQYTPSPEGFVIHGGRQVGETAWVEFTGRDAFGGTKGTATLRRSEGRWHVESMASTMTDD